VSDEFGDFDEDDAFDPSEPADNEQVARKLHEVRLDNGFEDTTWDSLALDEQTVRIVIIAAVLGWLRRQGTNF
jgi:uncharacterized protein (DUF849 family)